MKETINSEEDMKKDMSTDNVGGLMQLDSYKGSSMNLDGYKISRVLDDILMVQYLDTDTGSEVKRGGIFIPMNVLGQNQVWRIGKVLLAGPRCSIKVGERIVFPNDKGITVSKMGDMKNLVFLNEDRIFGVIEEVA
jgi:co-chaperonin GroES (HSP10)